MDSKKERNSNYELMRIISMFFIVLGHVILFSKLLETTNRTVNYFYYLLEFMLIIHVNSYVLVSGYFQSKSSFKQRKLWSIINSSWFYRILITIVFCSFGLISVSKVDILKDLLPISFSNYWFIKVYIMLYCLSPFINSFIMSVTKNQYRNALIVGFIIFCIFPIISNGELLFNTGYSLYSFVYLYLVGAYLRIYPLEKSYFFRIFSKKAFQLLMIIIFFICIIVNSTIFFYSKEIDGINNLFSTIALYIRNGALNYSNPIVVIQSVAYFCFFGTLMLKSKFINGVSKLMLGVYFIHENNYVRDVLYKWLGLLNGPINSASFIPYVLGCAILIFVACAIIEFFRQIIFDFINKRKIVIYLKKKYYDYLNELYIVKEGRRI